MAGSAGWRGWLRRPGRRCAGARPSSISRPTRRDASVNTRAPGGCVSVTRACWWRWTGQWTTGCCSVLVPVVRMAIGVESIEHRLFSAISMNWRGRRLEATRWNYTLRPAAALGATGASCGHGFDVLAPTATAGSRAGDRRGPGGGVGGGDHDLDRRVAGAGRGTRGGRLCAGVDDRRPGAGPAALAARGPAGLGGHPAALLSARLPGHLSRGAALGGTGHRLGRRPPTLVAGGRRLLRARRHRGRLPDPGATPASGPGAGRRHAGHRPVRCRAAAGGGG